MPVPPFVPFPGYDENRTRGYVEQTVRHAAEKQSADARQATRSHHDQICIHFQGRFHDLVGGAGSHIASNDQRNVESFLREVGRQLLESPLDFSLVSTSR